MSPETPQRCPLCDSDRRDIREMIYHPAEDAQCFDPWHDPWHTAPVPAIPSGNNSATGGESAANITERECVSPEPPRTLKQEMAEALEPNPNCGYCHGSGAMDSGGVTPWGTGIDIRCDCTYPEPPAAPTGAGEGSDWWGEDDDWRSKALEARRRVIVLEPQAEALDAENAALRSQLEAERLSGAGITALKYQIERVESLERDLVTAQRENVKLRHELADDEIELRGARNLEKTYISVKNDIATAQARIARLEQALQRARYGMKNYVRHEIGFEEALEKVEQALVEPPSGEK